MNKECMNIVNEIGQTAQEMLLQLEEGNANAQDFSQRAKGLGKLVENVGMIIPVDIFEEYAEYFRTFAIFCQQCESIDFLLQNVDDLASSLALFVECMVEISKKAQDELGTCVCCGNAVVYQVSACPNCSASATDRLIVSFLKKVQVDKAVAGERLLQIPSTRTIEHWIHGNCIALTYDSIDNFGDEGTANLEVQNIKQIADASYDYFVCHIALENEQQSKKVMQEVHRILKENGMGIFLGSSEIDSMNQICEMGFYVHSLGKKYFGEEVFRQCGLSDEARLYVLTKKQEDIDSLIEEKKTGREGIVSPQPLVSVILPTYNHEKYVEEAIESVLNQTYKNIEFLVADDGSTDGTVEKVLQYEDKIHQIHLFKENTGGNTGNFLRELATGKYVAVMHSDDVWDKEKLAMQVEYMETHPECGACFTGCACIEESGKAAQVSVFRQINITKERWLRHFFEHGNCLAHPSLLIHRDLYLELQKQCGARMFRQLPDFWMWVNLVLQRDIHIIEKNLTFFRFHEIGNNQNTSARTRENTGRHLVEESYIWYSIFKRMDNDTFLKAFGDRMIRKEVSSDEEILCEKMFMLLSPRINYLKQAGIYFMYDICQMPGIYEVLEEKYNWTRKDMARVSGELLS